MIINDGTNDFEFSEFEINYIRLQGSSLSFRLTDNTLTEIEFNDQDVLQTAIDLFVRRMHRKLATTGAGQTGTETSGLIYWVNVKNASGVSRSDSTITFAFTEGNSLSIVYENSTEAIVEKEAIDFNFNNADVDRFMSGKRIHRVNPTYTTNNSARIYSTYTAARAQAVSGDVILFENATYTASTERFSLKDGVDIVCDNTLFNVTQNVTWHDAAITPSPINKALFIDDSGAVTCYILGTMTVDIQRADVGGWLVLNVVRNGSKVYIAFDRWFYSGNKNNVTSYVHLYGSSRVWVKGRKAELSRIYDDDPNTALNMPVSCDYDVLYAYADSRFLDGQIYLPYSEICKWIIRNAYYEGQFFIDYNQSGSLKVINSKFDSGFAINYDTYEYIKLWRCLFNVDANVINTFGPEIVPTLNYNQSFSAGTSDPAAPDQTEPEIIANSNITIEAPNVSEDLGDIQPVDGELSYRKTYITITMPHIVRATAIQIYRDDVLFKEIPVSHWEDLTYVIPIAEDAHIYKVRATDGSDFTSFSNLINYNMAKINVTSSKFATGDTVFFMKNNRVVESVITKLMPEVSNPADDAEGVQVNKYLVAGQALPILENDMYFSKNALLAYVKGDYLTPHSIILDGITGADGGNDYGGHNFFGQDISGYPSNFEDSFVEGANFSGCTMQAVMDTKAEFRAYVAHYDPVTTIWIDGTPLGD